MIDFMAAVLSVVYGLLGAHLLQEQIIPVVRLLSMTFGWLPLLPYESPPELTGQPYTLADLTTSETHAVVSAVEDALNDYELGEPQADIRPRPWEATVADLDRLTRVLVAAGRLRPPRARFCRRCWPSCIPPT